MVTSPSALCCSSTGELGGVLLVRRVHMCVACFEGLSTELGQPRQVDASPRGHPRYWQRMQLSKVWEYPFDMVSTAPHLKAGLAPLLRQPSVHCAVRAAQGSAPTSALKEVTACKCTIWLLLLGL